MDAREFKQRFMPFHEALYRAAYHLTGSALDAEDLLQELYLRLWLKRDEIGPEKQTRSYLVAMLRNMHIDQVRHVRPVKTSLDALDDPPDGDTPESRLIEGEDGRRLSRLTDGLTDRERTIIRLHVEAEMDYAEIGRHTGLSPGNLRVIVARTKQKIKAQFNSISRSWKK